MDLQDALARALRQMEADGRSPLTRDQYRRHIGLLDRWLASTGRSREVEALGHEALAAFLTSDAARKRPDGQPKLATTMNALRTSLRAFFGYCHAAGYCPTDPARLVRRARCSPPPPRALTEAEVTRLLETVDAAAGPTAARDALLLRLLLGTGLRLSSALGLDVADLDLVHGEVRVRRMKGDRPDVVPLARSIVRELRRYLRGRASSGPLFPGEGSEPLTRRQAGRRIGQWAKAAGLGGKASAHVLRHVFAERILARTGNLLVVQAALRHRSLQSTTAYVRQKEGELRAALRA